MPLGLGLGGFLLLALGAVGLARLSLLAVVGLIGGLEMLLSAASYLYTTRRGKFAVWAELLTGLHLRGDERLLDLGCGRGAVLLMAADSPRRGRGCCRCREAGVGKLVRRAARPDEAAAIVALLHAAFAEYRGRLDPPSGAYAETEAGIRHKLAAAGGILAEVDGVTAGCVFVEQQPGRLCLSRLAVLPGYRRRGIGRALIEQVEARARAGAGARRAGRAAGAGRAARLLRAAGLPAGRARHARRLRRARHALRRTPHQSAAGPTAQPSIAGGVTPCWLRMVAAWARCSVEQSITGINGPACRAAVGAGRASRRASSSVAQQSSRRSLAHRVCSTSWTSAPATAMLPEPKATEAASALRVVLG